MEKVLRTGLQKSLRRRDFLCMVSVLTTRSCVSRRFCGVAWFPWGRVPLLVRRGVAVFAVGRDGLPGVRERD